MEFGKVPTLVKAFAMSPNNIGGQVGVRLENGVENGIGGNINVICIGPQPKEGDRGVVLFDSGINSDGYWLGTINNRFRNEEGDDYEPELPDGAIGTFNNTGSCGIITANSSVSMIADSMNLTLTDGSFQVAKNNLSMQFGDDGFIIKVPKGEDTTSSFFIKNSAVEFMSGGSFIVRSNVNVDYQLPGSFLVTGPRTTDNEDSIDLFKIKCRRALIDTTGGPLNISSSGVSIKVGSSQLSNANGVPGVGPSTAYAVEVVQGKMDLSVGIGDITVRSLSPSSSVKIVNGLFFIGPQSYFEADAFSAIMGAELLMGLTGATLTLNRSGTAVLKASDDITANSLLGNIEMESITSSIKLTAFQDFLVDCLNAKITAQIKMEVETMLLDLTNATEVDFGPATAVPSSSGPLCSMPTCPILGCVHVGEKSIG